MTDRRTTPPGPSLRRATAHATPPLSALTAAFGDVGPRAAVRPEEQRVHEAARRGRLVIRGHDVATYSWGGPGGGPAVLLVHGWQMRASRFAALVGDLVAGGFRVVAFDGIAHGESTGTRTTILDHLAVIGSLAAAEEVPFAGVVGHSFGGLAAGLALHEGLLSAERYVGLAVVSGWDSILDGFAATAGLPRATRDALSEQLARTVFSGVREPADRFDLVRHPVPESVATLFVHDGGDSQVPFDDAVRLHAAHPGSRLHPTSGLGHNRVVVDPAVRSLVVEHLTRVDVAAAS